MSLNYQHISVAGRRILQQVNNPSKAMSKHLEKQLVNSIPEFMRPHLKKVPEDCQFKSERDWKFLPGDRVVILAGECAGNIAYVKRHDQITNGYVLDENGPSVEVAVPKQFWQEGQTSHVVAVPKTLSQKEIRLVADIEDAEMPGVFKTVAIDNIMFKGTYYDDNYKKKMPYRCVYGDPDLIIPWPKPEFQEDGPLATAPSVAREQTFWVDTIARNPIPSDAFLTIRNPHSKYKRGKITAQDLRKLVAPEMPISETKKAFVREQVFLAKRDMPTLTQEDKFIIAKRVEEFLKQKDQNTTN
ncbi:hypothetical protein KAFR_0B03140 [Kazachstania africana CBS 2517]|uniref:KOW domain-containing protein n=1 Tax=Kazachstania africana (strain ATCC 22294 / BCRC 22015 / CBS 2517 / CECT 1963 / NBRC 1671 / NRRL Y-8276) TaxID=1071382 RepID=H2AQG0_KAZAF|nr:hypothetical protein KAFR_0B03140 [Kazachstania africana CBS 2517]CCF56610.1 hypothetical protein KAFR_0B03140 [Kazachstania africana CBS 2517]